MESDSVDLNHILILTPHASVQITPLFFPHDLIISRQACWPHNTSYGMVAAEKYLDLRYPCNTCIAEARSRIRL